MYQYLKHYLRKCYACLSPISCGFLAAESMSFPCAYSHIIDPFKVSGLAETFPDSPATRQEQHQCCKKHWNGCLFPNAQTI